MLPADIHARLAAMIAPFGYTANAYAMVSASSYCDAPHGTLMIYPLGTSSEAITVRADTWEAAFDEAAAKLSDWSAQRGEKLVRRLALAIIEQTADSGICTADALLKAGFTTDELATAADAACAHAAELARASFTILRPEDIPAAPKAAE